MRARDTSPAPSSPLEALATAYRTLFFDLPLAEARLWLGIGVNTRCLMPSGPSMMR